MAELQGADRDGRRTRSRPAQRQGDFETASRLQYGTLLELRRELEQREAAVAERQADGEMLLKEEVDADDIAEVVSKWTRHPGRRS